jgi:hypothetical protein
LNRELYFIPVLQNALKSADPESALREAFCKISQLGKDNRYKQGFENFKIFTNEACSRRALCEKNMVEDLSGCSQSISLSCELIIFRDDILICTVSLDESKTQSIRGIVQGTYTVKLSTGRVIWRGYLSQEDLIIRKSPGSQSMKLAADSDDLKTEPARVVTLLSGQMALKFFKGFDSGVIQIEME